MKKAIIIGATSGIGKSLAELLIREGYEVGVTGRREELFQSIKTQETSKIVFKKEQGYGHLVNISSIAGIRGNGIAPSYNATKAYQINYLEGLRINAKKYGSSITITDVRPGFVDTAMAKGEGLFWVAPVQKAAEQIFEAIKQKKKVVYITKRWKLIALLLRIIPFSILKRV